jgi:hypothetical protein
MDGRTDMTKLIVAFRNFANAPNTSLQCGIAATVRLVHSLNRHEIYQYGYKTRRQRTAAEITINANKPASKRCLQTGRQEFVSWQRQFQ